MSPSSSCFVSTWFPLKTRRVLKIILYRPYLLKLPRSDGAVDLIDWEASALKKAKLAADSISTVLNRLIAFESLKLCDPTMYDPGSYDAGEANETKNFQHLGLEAGNADLPASFGLAELVSPKTRLFPIGALYACSGRADSPCLDSKADHRSLPKGSEKVVYMPRAQAGPRQSTQRYGNFT